MVKKDIIPEEIMNILACPVCKGDLRYNSQKTGLVCSRCNEEYEIKDGIPILLPKSAGDA